MTRRMLPCALAIASTACTALNHAAPHQFLEPSYIAPYTSSDTTISYEGFVAPHIFFVDQQPAAFDTIGHSPTKRAQRGSRVILSPMFIVRQLTDSSSAVRTPSFMPRLTYEYFEVARLRDTAVGGTAFIPATPQFNWTRITGYRVIVAHHSDGQAGCFLEGQTPGNGSFEADDCTPPPSSGTLRVNRANGDFSTTYLGFAAHRSYIRAGNGDKPAYSFGGLAEFDWHVPVVLWGRLPKIERQFYGSWRANAQLNGAFSDAIGQWKATFYYQQAPTKLGPLASRLAIPIVHHRYYADVSHTFDALGGTGPFARWVDGQDYYNVGFVNRRRALLLGWVIDLSGYPPGHQLRQ